MSIRYTIVDVNGTTDRTQKLRPESGSLTKTPAARLGDEALRELLPACILCVVDLYLINPPRIECIERRELLVCNGSTVFSGVQQSVCSEAVYMIGNETDQLVRPDHFACWCPALRVA